MADPTTIHGDQLGLDAWFEAKAAAAAKSERQLTQARRAGKGAETSRAARPSRPRASKLDEHVVEEIRRRGPGTADQLGHRLRLHAPEGVSEWGPQTMSSTCNRLMRQRRIMRRRKDENASGRLAWVWEIREPGDEPEER